jgi:hypothetical protein
MPEASAPDPLRLVARLHFWARYQKLQKAQRELLQAADYIESISLTAPRPASEEKPGA